MKISNSIVYVRLLFIGMTVVVLSGCPPPSQISIFNNGTKPAGILLVDGSVRDMPAKKILNISDYDESGIKWGELEVVKPANSQYFSKLNIFCKGVTRSYNLSMLYLYAGSSGKVGNSGLVISKLQLEEDCKLYRVSFDEKFPYKQIYKLTPFKAMPERL